MLEKVTLAALSLISFSALLLFIRLLRGPSVADRIMVSDAILILVAGGVLLLSVRYESDFYIDIAIVIGGLAFLGTVAITKFILKGRIIDGDSG